MIHLSLNNQKSNIFVSMKQQTIEDSDFGTIIIHQHATARHIIYRIKLGQVIITVPPKLPISTILSHIDQDREKIKRLIEKKHRPLQIGDILITHSFTIHIVSHQSSEIRFSFHERLLTISCPASIPADDIHLQQSLKKGICRFLHQAASTYLPQKVELLSRQVNVSYSSVSISHGRQRLGKCDIRRNITLSYHLMLLPDRLIDYVIYHELAHISEMNHSKRFHEICNRYCNGQEKTLEKELKQFPFPFS